MKYRTSYLKEWLVFKASIICTDIGEWFLWQGWKHYASRSEFDDAIGRFRAFGEIEVKP
jgi:hypothetical protein